MGGPSHGHFLLPVAEQLLGGIVADGLEEVIAGRRSNRLGLHEALVDERSEDLDDVVALDLVHCAHLFGGSERPSVHEDREPAQRPLLGRIEELERPVDGCSERLLAGHRRAAAAGQQPETVVEALGDLDGRQPAKAGCRQLQREGNPVELPADRCHGDGDVAGGLEVGYLLSGAIDEQLHGFRFRDAPVAALRARNRERWHPEDLLARDSEGLAVARTDTSGHDRNKVSVSSAHAVTRCSQLSRTSKARRVRRASTSTPMSGRPGSSRTPTASAVRATTSSVSLTGASSTSQTSDPESSTSSAAACKARRVLPAPPDPVKVTRRFVFRRPLISASSRDRPMKEVNWAGRLCRSWGWLSDRSGGKSCCRPGARSWNTHSGWPRSFRRCSPRSSIEMPSGNDGRSRTAVAPDTTVWPP